MDFLDPHKRRSHTIRLFVGYALVAICLSIGTGILALTVMGFDLNRKTGKVIQNGLVFVDSHLDSSDIYLNGKKKGQTANRLAIPEGKYNMELKRNGYRTWQNQFVLEGSKILRYDYPFLFPTELVTKDLQVYLPGDTMSTQSPDRRWIIIQKPGSLTAYDQFDLNANNNDRTVFNLSAGLFNSAAGEHKLSIIEWSTDNKHFIVQHNYSGGVEYILISRDNPATSQNLSTYFSTPNALFSFRDKKFDQYYLQDKVALTLSTAGIKSKTTKLLISSLLSFKPYGADQILYVTDTGATVGNSIVRLHIDSEDYKVREVAKSDIYLLDMASFDNAFYAVVGSNAGGKVYVYKNPLELIKSNPSKLPEAVVLLKQDDPRFVSFSTNTRFISVQTGGLFSVYDIENQKQLRYDTKIPLPVASKANWMDGHRLTVVDESKIKAFDFDGTNVQTLNSANSDTTPFFDRDYKALFTFGPSLSKATQIALQRTELRLTAEQSSKLAK